MWSIRKAVEQWGKPFVSYKTKAILELPGEESLVFNLCPRKELFYATGVRRTPSHGPALAAKATIVRSKQPVILISLLTASTPPVVLVCTAVMYQVV